MNVVQFSRSKRMRITSETRETSIKDQQVIMDNIPYLKDAKLLDTKSIKKAISTGYDTIDETIVNFMFDISWKVSFFGCYLSEDDEDTIANILDGKLTDPYIDSVSKIINDQFSQLNPKDILSIFMSMDENFNESSKLSIRTAWKAIKCRISRI